MDTDSESNDQSIDSESDISGDSVTVSDTDDDNKDSESEEVEEDDHLPLKERAKKFDGIWERKKRKQEKHLFAQATGPNIPDNVSSPIEIFFCLFTHDLIETIVEQTNLYCTQNHSKENPVSKEEMLKFLGINILMGVKKSPSYKDYWSTNPQLHDSYISKLMRLNRFGFLLSHLHINDNTKEPRRGESNYDKLYKIRPMITKLNESFRKSFWPNQRQAIDESMIKFKGRSSIKQYNKAKPIKRGYKLWVRADQSGYVCEFQVYTGKVTNSVEKSLGDRVVRDLTRDLVGKYHEVYFDNFFTSVNGMISLKKDGVYACGTVRNGRIGLPKNQIRDKDMKRGDYEWRTSCEGISWVKWKDNRVLMLISNFHDPSMNDTVKRKQKDGSSVTLDCSKVVADYNKYMGFVDKADQKKSTYGIDRKSKKWWPRIFWHLVDTALTNAFIIYVEQGNEDLNLKDFRLAVVDALVGNIIATKKGRKAEERPTSSYKPTVSLEKRRAQAAHMPIVNPEKKQRRCAQCSSKKNLPKLIGCVLNVRYHCA